MSIESEKTTRNEEIQALDLARKSLASTIRKNEKAYETLSQKTPPRTGQMNLVARNLRNFRVCLAVIEGTAGLPREDLETALAAVPGYVAQIEKVLPKFPAGTSQHTLAVRRIAAYHLAETLLRAALG